MCPGGETEPSERNWKYEEVMSVKASCSFKYVVEVGLVYGDV